MEYDSIYWWDTVNQGWCSIDELQDPVTNKTSFQAVTKRDLSKPTWPPLPVITPLGDSEWISVSLKSNNSNRRDVPADCILLTEEMSRTLNFLLGHFSPGRYKPNEGPGLFFLSGLSGTGKSCLLKIFADKIKHNYHVLYAREPHLLPRPLPVAEDENKPVVIIMDQADKDPGPALLDSLPGRNRIAVVCASANLECPVSMSANFTTLECKLKLRLTYAEFCAVVLRYTDLHLQSMYAELDGAFDSWLSFSPSCLEHFYTFTQGHAMSIVLLCREFEQARQAGGKTIDATIKLMFESSSGLSAELVGFLHKSFIRKPESFFMLSNMFEKKMLELSSKHADERFFVESKIYSPLYLQACSKALHSFIPLEPDTFMNVITSLHNGNASFKGILVERLALGNEMLLFEAAVSCLKVANIAPPPAPKSIETVFWTGTTLGHAKDPGDFVHYIPSVSNFPHVDLLQVYTWTAGRTKHTLLLGNQITIQSSHEHRGSLSWFLTLAELEAELIESRKPHQLHSFLLYSCSGAGSHLTQKPPPSAHQRARRRVFRHPYWRLLRDRQAGTVCSECISFDTSEVIAPKRKASILENVEEGKKEDQAATKVKSKTPTSNRGRATTKTLESSPASPSRTPTPRKPKRPKMTMKN
eukprot:GILK01009176.1.p1 GENE.GILK01009176.1~~GILK01009176.1.p1  ORF type:complete len:699 (-),score=48.39 GILK01009176.1:65-1990(-)